jgi:hypothetical protein
MQGPRDSLRIPGTDTGFGQKAFQRPPKQLLPEAA